MVGNNSLCLCQVELEAAVEYYLNAIVFKQPVSVTSIKLEANMAVPGYVVNFTDSEVVAR